MKARMKTVFSIFIMSVLLTCTMSDSVFAMSDGAYIVGRSVYYGNPETNEQLDNSALGQSMAESVLDDTILVEQTNGTYYITIGIGLSSNVSNIRAYAQSGKGGSYSSVSLTKTGSTSKDGDTCNHYRFKASGTSAYFKIIMYVDPMGRDVEFYYSLKMSSAKPGTGHYVSEMIQTATEAPVATEKPATTKAPAETKAPTATKAPEKTTKPSATEKASETKSPTSTESAEQTSAPEENDQAEDVAATEAPEAVSEEEETHSEAAEEEKEDEEAEESASTDESVKEENEESDSDQVETIELELDDEVKTSDIVIIIAGFAVFLASCGYGYVLYKKNKGQKGQEE